MVPNQIERETLIQAPVEIVWGVVTEPEQISRWFADAAELDLRPGGEGTFTWESRATVATDEPAVSRLRVEKVDRPHVFSFRWGYPGDAEPRETNSVLVEFTLTPEGQNTRLRVVESGLAQVDWSEARRAGYLDDHAHGWEVHLGRLAEYAGGLSEAAAT